jgi:hypothetical protein
MQREHIATSTLRFCSGSAEGGRQCASLDLDDESSHEIKKFKIKKKEAHN